MAQKSSNPAPSPAPTISSYWRIFTTFALIGVQSFGGGSATFLLIHQACMKYGWMTEEEFIKSWAICQLVPGINLIKLTILIGNRLRGWRGVLVAATGLLAPSSILTILMTAFYTLYKDLPSIKSAMRGILPATIGLSLAMSSNMIVPLFKAARAEGRLRFILQGLVIAACGVAMALGWLSPVMIMASGILLTMLFLTAIPVPPPLMAESREP